MLVTKISFNIDVGYFDHSNHKFDIFISLSISAIFGKNFDEKTIIKSSILHRSFEIYVETVF